MSERHTTSIMHLVSPASLQQLSVAVQEEKCSGLAPALLLITRCVLTESKNSPYECIEFWKDGVARMHLLKKAWVRNMNLGRVEGACLAVFNGSTYEMVSPEEFTQKLTQWIKHHKSPSFSQHYVDTYLKVLEGECVSLNLAEVGCFTRPFGA